MALQPKMLSADPLPELYVLSSVIRKVAYDDDAQRLYVTFVNRQTYCYSGVAPATFAEFIAARSKGAYFNLAIRGNYAFHKVA
ncbi:MAG: KTSC domain-containing protein [Pseudorhodoplanes sp.]